MNGFHCYQHQFTPLSGVMNVINPEQAEKAITRFTNSYWTYLLQTLGLNADEVAAAQKQAKMRIADEEEKAQRHEQMLIAIREKKAQIKRERQPMREKANRIFLRNLKKHAPELFASKKCETDAIVDFMQKVATKKIAKYSACGAFYYLRAGKGLPTTGRLERMAEILQLAPEDLLPRDYWYLLQKRVA